MSQTICFRAPEVSVAVNGQVLGMAQSVELRVSSAPVTVRSFGMRDPIAVLKGPRTYTVTMRRLVMDRLDFPKQPSLSGLSEFTLSLSDGVLETTFCGCHVTGESLSCEAGKLLIETLELQAQSRTWNNLT